jgi:hypothetical protein
VDVQLRGAAGMLKGVEIPDHLPVRVQHDQNLAQDIDRLARGAALSSGRKQFFHVREEDRIAVGQRSASW